MRYKYIIAFITLIGFSLLLVFNLQSQASVYVPFSHAEDGRYVTVIGGLSSEIHYEPAGNVTTFKMTDLEGTTFTVAYNDPPPSNIREAERLVVDGYRHGDEFHAEHILVKCPSKYNDEIQ